jgi:hypothetical protein
MTEPLFAPLEAFDSPSVVEDIKDERFAALYDDTPANPLPNGKWVAEFKAPAGVSDRLFREVVSATYTAYIGCRGIPSIDDIHRYVTKAISKAKISEITLTEEFAKAITSRGIPWNTNEFTGISAAQQYAIAILTNPANQHKKLSTKLQAAGVTYAQYRAWLKQPTFSKYLNDLTEGMLNDHIPDLHTKLMEKALDGDLKAIQYVYELNGRHDPNKQQIQDLNRVVEMLIEVVSRNVTDPTTLTRIANEMQLVMQGKNLPPTTTIKGEIANGN